MKPRVGLVVPGLVLGGGVPAVARFVQEAASRDGSWEVKPLSLCMSSSDNESTSLRSPRTWLRGAMAGERSWHGHSVKHVGANFGEIEFQRYRPRAALTRALADCDIVQVVCGSPAWANCVIGLGKPVAMQVATLARIERRMRDAKPRSLAAWWRRGMTAITRRLDDRALRHVDAIQVENLWMLDYARRINAGRDVDVRYAPPGIDAQRFSPLPNVDRMQDPYILCVGRLADPRKNAELLLRAYSALPEDVRGRVRLVLAGSDGLTAAFWRSAEELGVRSDVSFVQNLDDRALVQLYQHAAVFALPSDEEGLGIVILEAMGCGVPVVATRCGGPEGVITDAADGFLVPRGDAIAMSARLLALLQERQLNASMGLAARLTIERRYDERVAGRVFLDAWERLLHKARAS